MKARKQPILTVIAGPNGSGKSTLTAALWADLHMPVIDPDAIARSIDPLAPERAAVAAGREAIRRQVQYLESGASFAVETTLAGNTILRRMEYARRQGFTVHLIFVGTEDVQTNIERIAERVARGGHDVPEIDVRRRFSHSMHNLTKAIELTDRATISTILPSKDHERCLRLIWGRSPNKRETYLDGSRRTWDHS